MVNHTYAEGSWFAVPLRPDGFALGLVARANPGGVLLGYFFGPRRQVPPSLADATGSMPEDAVLVGKFGHLGIQDGSWPLLGCQPDWNRSTWPTAIFVRYEELTGRTFQVHYDDADPNLLISESVVEPGPAEQGPKDGLMGTGFAARPLGKSDQFETVV